MKNVILLAAVVAAVVVTVTTVVATRCRPHTLGKRTRQITSAAGHIKHTLARTHTRLRNREGPTAWPRA